MVKGNMTPKWEQVLEGKLQTRHLQPFIFLPSANISNSLLLDENCC